MRTVLILLAWLWVSVPSVVAQERLNLDWPALAQKIVERMALEPGEKVLLVAHPDMFGEIVPHLRYEVMKAGAVDLGVIDVLASSPFESWNPQVLQRAAGSSREAYRAMFRNVDAGIMLPGARPFHSPYAALQDLLREGRGRTVHFHWLEGGSAFPIPGQPLPPLHVIDATYQKALLNTDYKALARIQQSFEESLRGEEIQVTTPLGTDLRFRVGSRPVNHQDGDASRARAESGITLIDREIELPAGALRVAPLEETVEGTIAFPPSQWDSRPVVGLKLRFDEGRVVNISADSGLTAVEAEMNGAGPAGRSFREFALGFNEELAVPDRNPWIPYYGYGAGVVRLSLGDNSELGGTVTGGYVRWNFFTDATVTVGDQVWVRDGKLLLR